MHTVFYKYYMKWIRSDKECLFNEDLESFLAFFLLFHLFYLRNL